MVAKIVLGVVGVALLVGGVMAYKIGPRNIVGMLMYDQRREGTLKVGDQAPDVTLVGLDGTQNQALSSRFGSRPVVLVFGSFT